MDWHQLLNKARLGGRSAKDESGRTAFLRDHDKIIFSGAFRRLARKTQVHPLATNDHVHNRLTHSLEVSCVGRTLGIRVGERLQQRQLLPDTVSATDLGDIVQSACLAHDIGNPPFGHTGERAIRAWFQERGQRFLAMLAPEQQSDLTFFEGNAQGFRIITKSEYHQYDGGMRLTYATLATFLKYPWLSVDATDSNGASSKPGKYSAFVSEADAFREVAAATGLREIAPGRFCRHPLAYLMEAADDFCYAIIDLEDGLEMDLLHWDEVYALLQPALRGCGGADVGLHRDVHPDIACRARQHRADDEAGCRDNAEEDEDEHRHDHTNNGNGGILALEIGLRTFLNGRGDFLHLFVAGAGTEHLAAGDEAVHDGKQPQRNCYENKVHGNFPSRLILYAVCAGNAEPSGLGV